MGFITEYFQKRTLKKDAFTGSTQMLPLSSIKTANILMDAAEPTYNNCKERIDNWLKANGIRGEFHFFDFRKLEKDELLITSIQTTILRKDLNWFDCPDRSAILLTEHPCDIFISMIADDGYPNRYMSACANARFKVGLANYPGNPFDLVVEAGPGSTADKLFEKMADVLSKIQ